MPILKLTMLQLERLTRKMSIVLKTIRPVSTLPYIRFPSRIQILVWDRPFTLDRS